MLSVREVASDADADSWAELWGSLDPLRPISSDRLTEALREGDQLHWLFLEQAGEIIGAAHVGRPSQFVADDHSFRFDLRVVDAAYLASGLQNALPTIRHLTAASAAPLIAFVETEDPQQVYVYLEAGFIEVERNAINAVELNAAFVRSLQAEVPPEFTITTLAERPELAVQAYEVEQNSGRRIPSAHPWPETPFERWYEWLNFATAGDGFVLIAVDESGNDDRVGGLVVCSAPSGKPGHAYIRFTGVHDDYLRRGIARSLKLEAASRARAHGWKVLGGTNHVANEPIMTLNRALGYQPIGVRVILEERK